MLFNEGSKQSSCFQLNAPCRAADAWLSRDVHDNWSRALRELRYALELDLLNCVAKRHEYGPCSLLICANQSLRLMFNAHFHKIQSGSN